MRALILLRSFLNTLKGLVRVVPVVVHICRRLQYELVYGNPSLTHAVFRRLFMLGCRRL